MLKIIFCSFLFLYQINCFAKEPVQKSNTQVENRTKNTSSDTELEVEGKANRDGKIALFLISSEFFLPDRIFGIGTYYRYSSYFDFGIHAFYDRSSSKSLSFSRNWSVNFNINKFETSEFILDSYVRVRPLQGTFSGRLGLGYVRTGLKYNITLPKSTDTLDIDMQKHALVVTGFIGNQWNFGDAFIGCDWLGFNLPIQSKVYFNHRLSSNQSIEAGELLNEYALQIKENNEEQPFSRIFYLFQIRFGVEI